MSDKPAPDFTVVLKVARQMVSDETIATHAADDGARGHVMDMTVRDRHVPEIVVGHMMVAIFYGSESAIEKAKEALLQKGTIIRKGECDL